MDDTRKDSAARSFLGDRDASLRLGQSDRDMWEVGRQQPTTVQF